MIKLTKRPGQKMSNSQANSNFVLFRFKIRLWIKTADLCVGLEDFYGFFDLFGCAE